MSDNLACARDCHAADWLASYDPGDGHGLVGREAMDPGAMFTQPVVIAAYVAGMNQADAEHAIERSTGQRQLDTATALMEESAALFMGYAEHHWARGDAASDMPAQLESFNKARVNLLAALRLKEWLAGQDHFSVSIDLPGVTSREQAERIANRGNLRPVPSGPLSDHRVVDSIMAATSGDARGLSVAAAGTFRMQTSDPRFDPAQPVVVNGFRFTPATES